MPEQAFIALPDYREYSTEEMKQRAAEFYAELRRRRTVREFSSRPVPRAIIEDCLRAAGTAPNGANMQPWHFVVVSDPGVKRQIRDAGSKKNMSSTMAKHRRNGWTRSLLWGQMSTSHSWKMRRI
jgi:hypothetical protein